MGREIRFRGKEPRTMSLPRSETVSVEVSFRSRVKDFTNAGVTLLTGATAKRGFVTLADQAVCSATNFLTGVIIGRGTSKEEFGLYMLGFTIVLFLMSFQDALITSPYTVHSPKKEGLRLARFSGSTLIHQLSLSVFACVCLMVAVPILAAGIGPAGLGRVAGVLAMAITALLLKDYARRICFAKFWGVPALAVDTTVAILQIGGLLLLASRGVLSANSAYSVMGVVCAAASVGWLFWARRSFSFSFTDVLADLGANWAFGKWLLAAILASTASAQFYPWFLAGFDGLAATANLSVCLGVLYLANPFVMGMENSLSPKIMHAFAHGGLPEMRRVVSKATWLFAVIMGLFCSTMMVFGGMLLPLIYGQKYQGHGLVVGILASGQFVSSMTFPINNGLLAMNRPDAGFKGYLFSVAITFTLGLWLVKTHGYLGAAIGLVAGNITASLYRWVIYQRTTHARME